MKMKQKIGYQKFVFQMVSSIDFFFFSTHLNCATKSIAKMIKNNNVKGECTVQCTKFEGNLELYVISKIATCKISLTLNYFKDHI
jgi:hypothetical protein